MAENSPIEWTDHTFNPWVGCRKVSQACDHCYAEAWANRTGHPELWAGSRRRTSPANWRKPRTWEKKARVFFAEHARRQRVFCASLADVFDNDVQESWRSDLFRLIRKTPSLDWLLLTKRIGNARSRIPFDWLQDPPPHVWFGITVVNQAEADRDVPKLLDTPARIRFLSLEPMLGPMDLSRWLNLPRGADRRRGIDWVIVGGESGPGSRPMHPAWPRSIRDQCAHAGVPFFFKQWGDWSPAEIRAGGDLGGDLRRGTVQHLHAPGNPEGHFRRGDAYVRRVGKKRGGRELDRRIHDGFPDVA